MIELSPKPVKNALGAGCRNTWGCACATVSSISITFYRYLREQAGQDARKRVAAPFVLCEGKSNAVLGYYTLSALSVDAGAWPEDLARKLPKYPFVSATLMGRLAIDRSLRGKGAGEHLLMDALRRTLGASREVASVAVVLDAKDDNAVSFYRRYGFITFPDQPNRLFLPIAVVEHLFGDSRADRSR